MLFQIILSTLRTHQLSNEAQEIIMASLAESTKGQYAHHLTKFKAFCTSKNQDWTNPISCELGIEFLTTMFKSGLSYSSINTARSAISQFTTVKGGDQLGSHPLANRFMKGLYRLRPPLPKYDSTWDVSVVLKLLENLDTTNLKHLSLKCCMLLALTTGQRVQTLAALDLAFLSKSENVYTFAIHCVTKTSKPGKATKVEILKFSNNNKICPLNCLKMYLEKTATLRSSDRLFISFSKPHKTVTSQTLSRWLVEILNKAGIDTRFGAHSTRSASTSKAWSCHVPIDQILATAGWSSERVFASFYRKEIRSKESFSDAVLTTSNDEILQ